MAYQLRKNVRFARRQRFGFHNQVAIGWRVGLRDQVNVDGRRGRANVGGRELVNYGRDVVGGVLRCLSVLDKLGWH